MTVDYDAVIIGAGLSGLSLASRLAESSWADRRILLVDDGMRSAAAATWDTIAVHASGTSAALPLHPYRYVAISGERLHDVHHARLAASSNVEFVTRSADAVRGEGDHALVTVDGAAVTARWAFDSRPLSSASSGPRLDFLGWEIDADADAFDPTVATFMDFRGREPGTVSFCYLLPTTARHALVEIAMFTWRDAGPDLARALTDYLRQVCGVAVWTVTRTEAGSLPLAPPAADVRGGRVIPIGVRGGMLKPSTGFAVERIQRHSAAIAGSLDRYGHPHAIAARHRRHAWLDRVFLEVLRRDPDVVEDVMAKLFTRNSAPAVLRFLDEDSSPAQEARLVATLPVSPFLRAALRGPS